MWGGTAGLEASGRAKLMFLCPRGVGEPDAVDNRYPGSSGPMPSLERACLVPPVTAIKTKAHVKAAASVPPSPRPTLFD